LTTLTANAVSANARNWWNNDTDSAILKFTQTDNYLEREATYSAHLYLPFKTLVDYLTGVKLSLSNEDLKEDLAAELLADSWKLLLTYRYPTEREPKPFAYFTRALLHTGYSLTRETIKKRYPFSIGKEQVFSDVAGKEKDSGDSNAEMLDGSFLRINDNSFEELDSFNHLKADIIEVLEYDIARKTEFAYMVKRFDKATVKYIKETDLNNLDTNDLKKYLHTRFPDITKQQFSQIFGRLKRLLKKKLNLKVEVPAGAKIKPRKYQKKGRPRNV
jgi:hypothetical protein